MPPRRQPQPHQLKRSISCLEGDEDNEKHSGALAPQRPLNRTNSAPICATDPTATYRGVTEHVRTKRFESHIWHNQKQIFLGGSDSPEMAAVAFDIAALRLRGPNTPINFHRGWYETFLQDIDTLEIDVMVAGLRRELKGNKAIQSSIFRGVTRHAKGKWEARIGGSAGEQTDKTNKKRKKYIYLGIHETEAEAAKTYDRAAIGRQGIDAVTNFHLSTYYSELTDTQVKEAMHKGILTEHDIALENFRREICAQSNNTINGTGNVGGRGGNDTSPANEEGHNAHPYFVSPPSLPILAPWAFPTTTTTAAVAITQTTTDEGEFAGLLYDAIVSPTSTIAPHVYIPHNTTMKLDK